MQQVLQHILDAQMTAVVLLDATLGIRFLNQSAEHLFEVSGTRMVGEPVRRLLCHSSREVETLQRAATGQQGFTSRQVDLVLAAGRRVTVDYTATPMFDALPGGLLLELVPLDRKLRINRDEQAHHSQETSRQLVRGMAHEVKNPLGGIRGAAQLLERELGSEQLREYTRVIIAETDRLSALVDRMLGPNQRPNISSINIHRILERVIQLVEVEAPRQYAFVRDYDPSLPELAGDADLLLQAVLNIVRNARQALAGNPEPRIVLRTRIIRQFTIGPHRHRLVARIDIIDNGPGIPPDIRDHMFFPMISGRPEGSGLGLSITRTIIAQHQGLIECDSRPGHTCFSLYLPLEPDRAKP